MQGRVVMSGGTESQPFLITNGVKQGCVMAPTLFSILFAAMLHSALENCPAGIKIRYRMDGQFFDLRRLKAKTKTSEALVRDFLYADDCALAAHSESALQDLADRLAEAATKFGLTISLPKTEVLLQPAPDTSVPSPQIYIHGTKLKVVDEFTYLGSCLSNTCNLDSEISKRLAKASSSFGRLWTRVWKERGLSSQTKVSVYKAVVLSALLYGCESWTLYRRQLKQLDQFHIRCLRKILKISRQEHVPNTEILRRANMSGIEAHITKIRLRWAGHVVRMEDHRLPKQLFHCELSQGERARGRPILRYKDTLKASLLSADICPSSWQTLASDRSAWRSKVSKGVTALEAKNKLKSDEMRAARKAQGSQPIDAETASICPTCGKVCRSQFGLRAHMRVH